MGRPLRLSGGQEGGRETVEDGLAPRARDVEVESGGHVIGALLEHATCGDVDGANRGREVIDAQVALRRRGASGPNLEIQAADDVGREPRVGKGEPTHAPLAVEGHRAGVIGEDHVGAAGHRRMSHVEEPRRTFLNPEEG